MRSSSERSSRMILDCWQKSDMAAGFSESQKKTTRRPKQTVEYRRMVIPISQNEYNSSRILSERILDLVYGHGVSFFVESF